MAAPHHFAVKRTHQLGRQLPRAGNGPLAGTCAATHRVERHLLCRGLGADVGWGGGDPGIKDKLLQGYSAGDKSFKVHLDGYDQRDLLSAKGPDKRREFFYWTDDGNLAGLRYDQYKVVFMEQPAAVAWPSIRP